MNTSLIVWFVTVGLFMAVVVIGMVVRAVHAGHHKLFARGTESEEFFVPGDVVNPSDNDYEDD